MQDTDNDSSGAVLLNTFVIKKKRCRVYFHRGTLIWETERPPYTRWTLPLTDALAARFADGSVPISPESKEKQSSPPTSSPTSFVLHYAAQGPKNKWSHHTVTMSHTEPRQVASWVKTIRNYLKNISQRPRKILIFVNPYGGKKKGLKIWEKEVQPLLKIAEIESRVIVTERAGHVRDTLLTTNLDDIQAVVCIGGDGTFAEVFNGLVLRTAKDHRIDPNDSNANFLVPSLPVGVIPSGSTDTLAYSLHGTTDVETAVIHIIFGDTTGLDLSSVHNNRSLLRLYASVLSYGYLGDVIRDSEKFRWMGPQRYDYSGFKKLMANKGYDGEIELLSDPCHPAASTRCMQNCTRCIQHMHNSVPDKEITRKLIVRGKFFMVNGANVSCACSRSPLGFSPHCHIGDGCVDVILVRHTSFINNLRMLLRLSSKNKTLYDLPFVEVYRAREFTFRALPTLHLQSENEITASHLLSGLSVWNCDGEVIQDPNVKIRVHCQLLKVYTRRVQENPDEPSCFCSL
ncbi:ceramide kinase [Orussus abietinus]|uniref:ceramide kinase n=1 Tax=Orussus abietinus TaxID=222816 RepID=UPI00062565E9|nr:ceramide kinase [Orussus abietinus]XP_012278631.1 ceramide kinase [Orussus abietinus]XP_023289792.1 ceramide kinase [Orussus abietinus]